MKLPRSSNVRWESRQARSKLVEAGIAPKKRHGFSLAPYGSSALVTVRFDTAEIREITDSYFDSYIDFLQILQMPELCQ